MDVFKLRLIVKHVSLVVILCFNYLSTTAYSTVPIAPWDSSLPNDITVIPDTESIAATSTFDLSNQIKPVANFRLLASNTGVKAQASKAAQAKPKNRPLPTPPAQNVRQLPTAGNGAPAVRGRVQQQNPIGRLPPPPAGTPTPAARRPVQQQNRIGRLPPPPAGTPTPAARQPVQQQNRIGQLPPPPAGTPTPAARQPVQQQNRIGQLPPPPAGTPTPAARRPVQQQNRIGQLPPPPAGTPTPAARRPVQQQNPIGQLPQPRVGNLGAPQRVRGGRIGQQGTTVTDPRARLIATNPNARRVFGAGIVRRFNSRAPSARTYEAGAEPVKLDSGEIIYRLKPGKNAGELGTQLGGGANSIVYRSKSQPNRLVNKFVRLTNNDGNIDPKADVTLTDQLAGRTMLGNLNNIFKNKGQDSLFRVAGTDGPPVIWKARAPNGTTQRFALTRDENISSPVYDVNGNAKLKANGERIKVTDARSRIEARGYELTPKEELTINLVVRGLNQNGIAWTDHKLANLDIVKDRKSPTGHRVVFFDFDAFRPVKGANRKERYKNAREIQRGFDTLKRGESASNKIPGLRQRFDYQAFGNDPNFANFDNFSYLYSAGANRGRKEYLDYDTRDAATINKATLAATNGRVNNMIELE